MDLCAPGGLSGAGQAAKQGQGWPQAWRVRVEHFPLQIAFARPNRTLAVSLTGARCALQCAHCGGHYLRGMLAIEDCTAARAAEATSCLISGGCDERGRVPVRAHLDQVRALRQGRILNWHVGMVDEEDVRAIAPCVDVISFDFLVDDETIREVYGLDYTGADYVHTYEMLRRHATVVPHLTVGLRGGRVCGEYRALQALRDIGLPALVVLVLIPTADTRYAHAQPPAIDEVAEFVATARCALPDVPIYLGCMRPGGRYRQELDDLAVQAGVNKIVNPAPSAISRATELGLSIAWESECCVIQRP